MAYRSWLAKAKSMHDIGMPPYLNKAGTPWNCERDDLAERKQKEFFERPVPVEEPHRQFFGSWMHDSGVMEIERTAQHFRVRLDCIHANDFIHNLIDVVGLPRIKAQWPVD